MDVFASSHTFEYNSDLLDVQSRKQHSTAPPTSNDHFVKWMDSMEAYPKRARRIREEKSILWTLLEECCPESNGNSKKYLIAKFFPDVGSWVEE